MTSAERPATNSYYLLWQKLTSVRRDLEIADACILLYIAAFVRQYLWIIDNNSLAWVLTILLSVLIWFAHLRTKEGADERMPSQFWLVVALPLFVIYAMRAAFPDTSFDVLDYRLINAERALRGFPFVTGDFFPTRFPFNPAPDIVTGISRHLLGYRLGTIINYLVVLWVGAILYRLLLPFIKSVWLRCAGVALLVFTEHVLFIVNNYMVDLLAIPLLLEATRLALRDKGSRSQNHSQTTVRIALFIGASVAFKLTNLAFALPILMIYARNALLDAGSARAAKNFLLLAVAFIAPLLPFTLYIYSQTGNPVFPLYNKIFMSPFWPTGDFVGMRWGPVVDDPRWGNMKWWEVLLWPVLLPFKLAHTAGGLGPHPGRISLCFIAAFLGLLLKGTVRRARLLSFIVFFGAILWSAISGMPRYAIYLELAGGVAILYVASRFRPTENDSNTHRLLKQSSQLLLFSVLVGQSLVSCLYVYRFEWGSRPSFFENPKAYIRDAKYFFRDYSLMDYLSQREKSLVTPVQAWIESDALESGIEVLLNENAPALCVYMPEYFSTEASRARFARSLYELNGKKMFALCFSDHLPGALSHINNAGLGVGRITQMVIPYYSDHTRIPMTLIEVLPPGHDKVGERVGFTQVIAALPSDALRAELAWLQPLPTSFRSGLKETVYIKVKNTSSSVWPALGRNDGFYRLFLGNHWLDENNTIVVNDDGRTGLPYDLTPNEEIELPLIITAPATPGNYTLEVDVLQEGVTWFGLQGSMSLRSRVKVN